MNNYPENTRPQITPGIPNHGWLWFVVLFLASLGTRLIVSSGLPPDPLPPVSSYPYALYNHFSSYFWYATLVPPLNYLLQAIPVFLLGPAGNAVSHGYLYLNFTLDIVASCLVFMSFRKLGLTYFMSLIIAMIFSLSLVPLELWRSNFPMAHYDHYTPVLASLLAYFCVRLAKDGMVKWVIAGASAAGSLIILQLPTASYLVPALFFCIAIIEVWSRRLTSQRWLKIAALMVVPLLCILALISKSMVVNGIPSPSSKGGAAMMMFVQSAFKGNPSQVRQLAVESGAPDWYLWCYDNPTIPPDTLTENKQAWMQLARAFGICMPWSGQPGVSGKPWPFDFNPLYERFHGEGNETISHWIALDRYDSLNRPYLSMGVSPELSSRWIGIYGRVSLRAGIHLLKTQPLLYFNAANKNYNELFWGKGPMFLARLSDDLSTRKYKFQSTFTVLNTTVTSALARAAYAILPIACVISLMGLALSPKCAVNRKRVADSFRIYLLLGIVIWGSTVIYSGAVAVENDRYFVHILPYLVVVFGSLVKDIGDVVRGCLEKLHVF